MNTKFLLLLFLPFMISCKSNENPKLVYSHSKLIYSHSDSNYKITIATIATKINKDGIAECSNYVETTISDTLYSRYGLRLKSIVAASHSTSPKYIGELPFDSLNNKHLDIRIENYTNNKLNFDSILSLSISNAFNLEVTPIDSLVSGYELIVIDSEKLRAHQTECDGGSSKYKNGTWTSSSSKLDGFTKILDQFSNSYINFKVPNENCYSIKCIVGNDIKKINKKLEPVGLMLKATDFKQTFYKIKPVANRVDGPT
ncbi:MAG: hypothetical protein K9H62_19820 [Bacteroidales bacterium]|nr:hypothetical protein [Bacteroidales bacterium]